MIVITARDLDAKDRERLNSGIRSVLVKESFQPAELIARIRRLVANDGAPASIESRVVTRLLYVEDNDDNVYMLKMRLELLDEFEVLVAEDGEKGCAAALEHKPDLILMDLDLPVVDGWEATRRLKSDPRTRDIPVIALSAHALAGAREKAIEAGCDEFDTKPVEFERLLGKIRQLLGR